MWAIEGYRREEGQDLVVVLNGIAEAVRQVRGTGVNQVPDVPRRRRATAGTGVPTSGLILSR